MEKMNFSLPPGGIVGIIGPNGAGKTTLLRLCAGLVPLARGEASVLGFNLATQRKEAQAHVGMLGHANGLYLDLTAQEGVAQVGLHGQPGQAVAFQGTAIGGGAAAACGLGLFDRQFDPTQKLGGIRRVQPALGLGRADRDGRIDVEAGDAQGLFEGLAHPLGHGAALVGHEGWGEAAPTKFYGETSETVMQTLQNYAQHLPAEQLRIEIENTERRG